MPGIDLTTALGRLLSDAALRREHARDPEALARRLDVDAAHLAAFLGLDRDGLEIQAEALIAKRFHEASELLPETTARLGGTARARFFELAETSWPTGHRRHLADAVAFCGHLARGDGAGPCPAEHNRLRFVLERRRLAAYFVRRWPDGGRGRAALQILRRPSRGGVRQTVVFLFP